MKKIIITSFLILSITFLLIDQSSGTQKKSLLSGPTIQQSTPGEKIYKQYCLSCHQADAGGVPNLTPPLINTPYVLGDKERLIKIVLNGLNENLEINDENFANPMPPLKILKDKQIADVLTYVRSNFGNKASAITAAEVKAVRAKK